MINIDQLLHLKDEKVVKYLRHHWAVYIFPTVTIIVLAAIPFGIIGLTLSSRLSWAVNPTIVAFSSVILSMYYMSIWMMFASNIIYYSLDTWIVTTHRIVYIEQKSLFFREISEQPLSRVQDVTSEVHGILPTLLGYGDIFVQTAGATDRFQFSAIADPTEVSRAIFQLVQDEQNRLKSTGV